LIVNLSVSSFQPLAFYVAIWLVNLFPDSTRYTMPTLEIEGVWKEWDRDEETGDVFQSGGTILEPPHCADISTCVKYRYLLSPLLTKMSLHEDRCLPPVDQLKEEIDSLLKHNKQG
jgi:hypothetical protein